MKLNKIAYSYLRVSSDLQLKGDGIRRQTEKAEKYCQKKGLKLSEHRYRDIASGFKGHNRSIDSQLTAFLDAVDAGRIRKGSTLVVEALDRLSRQTVVNALGLFTSILQRDIRIVTLIDEKEFTLESVNKNPMDLSYSLMLFAQANKESEYKKVRISDDWKNKRNSLDKEKITNSYPFWLDLKKNQFSVIEDKADIVRTIFEKYLSGYGVNKIARELNRMGLKTPMGKKWGQVNVKHFLRNPSVIGEYHVGKRVNGKKMKTGQVAVNYFPSIVSESNFYQAQERFKTNPPKRGKPQTEGCNLFDGLLKCPYCGGNLGLYAEKNLICWNGINGGCIRVAWNVEEYELPLLIECREALNERRQELNTPIIDEIDVLSGKIANLESEKKRGMTLLWNFPEDETLTEKMKEVGKNIEELRREREAKKALITEFKGENVIDIERITVTREPQHRLELNRLIKKHFQKIEVFSVGTKPEFEKYQRRKSELEASGLSGHQFHKTLKVEMKVEERRHMVIHCKTAVVRDGKLKEKIVIFPSNPSPENEKAYWELYENG